MKSPHRKRARSLPDEAAPPAATALEAVPEIVSEPEPVLSVPPGHRGVARFFIRGALVSLPLLLLLGFPTLILVLSGEVTPLADVARRQWTSPKLVLFGLAESGPEMSYKLIATLMRKPKYLAMGSSRAMAYRSRFFRDSAGFYNSGGAVGGFRHFRQFLENIPEGQQPKIAILCFEQRYFNENAGHVMLHDYQERLHEQPDRVRILFDGFRDTYKKILVEKKYSMEDLFPVPLNHGYSVGQMIASWRSMNKIGLMAIVNDNGYRNDGSYYYGKLIANPDSIDLWDYRFHDTISRVRRGVRGFQYGEDVWKDALDEIRVLLPYCRKRGIHVVAYLPPIAPTVLDRMKANGGYKYVPKIMPAAEPIFRENGVELYDFTDMRPYGSGDNEFIDGWHGSEKAYLRMFILMAQNDPVLRAEVDLPVLQQRLAATKSDYDVFGLDEY